MDGLHERWAFADKRTRGGVRKRRTCRGCDVVEGDDGLVRPRWAERSDVMREYYDAEWGTPVTDDREVFRILSILIFQAGLFWGAAISRAHRLDGVLDGFDPTLVSRYTDDDIERILNDPDVIRNRLKLRSVVHNARATVALEGSGGLARLVWRHRPTMTPLPQFSEDIPLETPESAVLASTLRDRGFTFVGARICFSLMQSIGVVDTHLLDTHRRGSSGLWNVDGSVARRLEVERTIDVRGQAGKSDTSRRVALVSDRCLDA